jgi:hypothetical protein
MRNYNVLLSILDFAKLKALYIEKNKLISNKNELVLENEFIEEYENSKIPPIDIKLGIALISKEYKNFFLNFTNKYSLGIYYLEKNNMSEMSLYVPFVCSRVFKEVCQTRKSNLDSRPCFKRDIPFIRTFSTGNIEKEIISEIKKGKKISELGISLAISPCESKILLTYKNMLYIKDRMHGDWGSKKLPKKVKNSEFFKDDCYKFALLYEDDQIDILKLEFKDARCFNIIRPEPEMEIHKDPDDYFYKKGICKDLSNSLQQNEEAIKEPSNYFNQQKEATKQSMFEKIMFFSKNLCTVSLIKLSLLSSYIKRALFSKGLD